MADVGDDNVFDEICTIVPGSNSEPCIKNDEGHILIIDANDNYKFVECSVELDAQLHLSDKKTDICGGSPPSLSTYTQDDFSQSSCNSGTSLSQSIFNRGTSGQSTSTQHDISLSSCGSSTFSQNVVNQGTSSQNKFCQDAKRKRRYNNVQIKKPRAVWTSELITQLIELVKLHKPLFESSTVTDTAVWQKITNIQKVYTAEQNKNKFRDLKDNYYDYVYALKQTGESPPPTWQFYDVMHDMLKDDPRTEPVSLASSSKGRQNLNNFKNTYHFNDDSSDKSSAKTSTKSSSIKEVGNKKSNAGELPRAKKTRLDVHLEQFNKKNKRKRA
ncbi:hypothetical protein HCN44_010920 [Aphidius gifuensis]|uniref:MADF domain-containing protein n=1 Tax=Aphidius gifuensis TaxID=684658 RepID=A0A834Y895_APHGI|nr:hypothetical protein HCN44_010920 [Aphidius gifuensis]